MQDIIAPTREAALMPAPPKIAQPSKHGYVIITLGFSTALGLGLAGGIIVHRLVDLNQTATWLQQTGNALQSGFTLARNEVASRIESFTSRPVSVSQASQEVTSAGPSRDANIERAVTDLSVKVDQVRAANEGLARDLSLEIEHLRSSAEQNQRELVTKLGQLTERVERVERQSAAATSAPAVAQAVVQPNASSRAKAVAKPVAQLTAPSPTKPVAKLVPRPATSAKAKVAPKQTSTETKPDMNVKGIANWSVRSVFNDTAVLEGPQGRIAVGPGDTIPGLGEIQAIIRSGGRWVVATSKGVITARKRVPYPEASADEW